MQKLGLVWYENVNVVEIFGTEFRSQWSRIQNGCSAIPGRSLEDLRGCFQPNFILADYNLRILEDGLFDIFGGQAEIGAEGDNDFIFTTRRDKNPRVTGWGVGIYNKLVFDTFGIIEFFYGISEYVTANRSYECGRYSGTGRRYGLIGTLSSGTGCERAD